MSGIGPETLTICAEDFEHCTLLFFLSLFFLIFETSLKVNSLMCLRKAHDFSSQSQLRSY